MNYDEFKSAKLQKKIYKTALIIIRNITDLN